MFVHGLFGNCRRTWGRMPQWVLEAAGLDLDVVSFSYPSRPWERAAIPQAADDLKTWLDTELQAYRHLVFVTHSSGGLVVRDPLRGAVLRTRRIINITVPHQGGTPFMTWFGKASYLALYPLRPICIYFRGTHGSRGVRVPRSSASSLGSSGVMVRTRHCPWSSARSPGWPRSTA